jgi:hypothetical protein
MRGKKLLVSVVAIAIAGSLVSTTPATAATIGSNLAAAPNDSVCKFQSFEPETHVCSVGQVDLLPSHVATGGLVAPFDGVIVRWSVVSGAALPGTGTVKLALRLMRGPGYLEKGPEVELPPSPAGTRHTFAERLPVGAGQSVGVKITISNRSTQEAGAPIAFREEGVGKIDTWTGEPWESGIWSQEEGVELLLDAEVEPDADRDGYGDLTQDCFPNHPGDQHLCGGDFAPPAIQPRFAARQGFFRSGAVVVRVASNEAGVARAEGVLEIKGRRGGTYRLRNARTPITAGGEVVLRLRLPKRALKAVRAARREGKRMVVKGRVGVMDAAGNEGQASVRVRSLKGNYQ